MQGVRQCATRRVESLHSRMRIEAEPMLGQAMQSSSPFHGSSWIASSGDREQLPFFNTEIFGKTKAQPSYDMVELCDIAGKVPLRSTNRLATQAQSKDMNIQEFWSGFRSMFMGLGCMAQMMHQSSHGSDMQLVFCGERPKATPQRNPSALG